MRLTMPLATQGSLEPAKLAVTNLTGPLQVLSSQRPSVNSPFPNTFYGPFNNWTHEINPKQNWETFHVGFQVEDANGLKILQRAQYENDVSAKQIILQISSLFFFLFSPQTAADLIVWLNQPPSVSPPDRTPLHSAHRNFLKDYMFCLHEEIREGREYVKRQRITAVPDDKLRRLTKGRNGIESSRTEKIIWGFLLEPDTVVCV